MKNCFRSTLQLTPLEWSRNPQSRTAELMVQDVLVVVEGKFGAFNHNPFGWRSTKMCFGPLSIDWNELLSPNLYVIALVVYAFMRYMK